jgi:hypothetical protein
MKKGNIQGTKKNIRISREESEKNILGFFFHVSFFLLSGARTTHNRNKTKCQSRPANSE